MSVEGPTPRSDESATIAFGEKLLSLLDTGSFTTSQKYAVLLALLDAVLESTRPDGSAPRVLHGRDLGRRVFELYWRQARPFLEAFLSGTRRTSLLAVREPLLELQAGPRLYCGRAEGPWDVDHFLPWARGLYLRQPVGTMLWHARGEPSNPWTEPA